MSFKYRPTRVLCVKRIGGAPVSSTVSNFVFVRVRHPVKLYKGKGFSLTMPYGSWLYEKKCRLTFLSTYYVWYSSV